MYQHYDEHYQLRLDLLRSLFKDQSQISILVYFGTAINDKSFKLRIEIHRAFPIGWRV